MTQKIYQKIKTRMRYYKRKDGFGRLIYRKKNMTFFWVVILLIISNTIFWSSLNRADPWLKQKEKEDKPMTRTAKTGRNQVTKYTSLNTFFAASVSPGKHKKKGGQAFQTKTANRDQDTNPEDICAGEKKLRQMDGAEQHVMVPGQTSDYDGDMKEKMMAYNMKHLDDPLRGYGLSPKTVSMTYKIKKIKKSVGNLNKKLNDLEYQLKVIRESRMPYQFKDARLKNLQDSINQLKKTINTKQNKISNLKSALIREFEEAVDSTYAGIETSNPSTSYENTLPGESTASKSLPGKISRDKPARTNKNPRAPKLAVQVNTNKGMQKNCKENRRLPTFHSPSKPQKQTISPVKVKSNSFRYPLNQKERKVRPPGNVTIGTAPANQVKSTYQTPIRRPNPPVQPKPNRYSIGKKRK